MCFFPNVVVQFLGVGGPDGDAEQRAWSTDGSLGERSAVTSDCVVWEFGSLGERSAVTAVVSRRPPVSLNPVLFHWSMNKYSLDCEVSHCNLTATERAGAPWGAARPGVR